MGHFLDPGAAPQCEPAINLRRQMLDADRFAAVVESGMSFTTYGEIRVADLYAIATEYAAGVTPEIGIHVRWVLYPGAETWTLGEATAYRAALHADTGEPYRDTIHTTLPAALAIALADVPAIELTRQTRYV